MEIVQLALGSFIFKGKGCGVLLNVERPNKYPDIRMVAYNDLSNFGQNLADGQVCLAGPGSYEVAKVEAQGISVEESRSIYWFAIDGVDIVAIPKLNEMLNDKKIERLEEMGVDICLLDVSGKCPAKNLLEIVKKVGANYVIPFGGIAEVKAFLDVADCENLMPVGSLKVEPGNLPEGLEVVSLVAND
jgi:hypothetical protein